MYLCLTLFGLGGGGGQNAKKLSPNRVKVVVKLNGSCEAFQIHFIGCYPDFQRIENGDNNPINKVAEVYVNLDEPAHGSFTNG